jgi:acyl dehydratase
VDVDDDNREIDSSVVGSTLMATRAITAEDIDVCGQVTGDFGSHHVSGLAGRQMAQGLLTLSVAPLFGDEGVHMRELSVKFLAPVFASDTVTAVVEITGMENISAGLVSLSCTVTASNAEGAEVLRGSGVAELARELVSRTAAHRTEG